MAIARSLEPQHWNEDAMATVLTYREALNPLHAILLAFPVALFTGTVLSDWAYLATAEIQWSNFSAWLNAFGLLFGGVVLAWGLVSAILRPRGWRGGRGLHIAALAVMWVFGFLGALVHGRDAWYSVTAAGMILSLITAAAALAAGWTGFRGFPRKEAL
ncbi:DUF2231 domain-containing protein [Sphingobium xenophagum]|uniref:DUF2231 domain-containing protein n=1 Tax=Sphingobium xenophagum TaxID=121428 RepID=UPI00209A9396|nr:DUF2231 domain-containing protein [Sphingobium xenophagum]